MNYDHWKTTNPDDEQLGSADQSGDQDEPLNDWPTDEQLARWEHFGRYDEELCEPDESSAQYQDRERNR